MLSGVGPAEHLKAHGIPVVHDLPGVGSHLVDHPIVDMHFLQKGFTESYAYMRPKSVGDVLKLMQAVFQYTVLKTGGPLSMNVRSLGFRVPVKRKSTNLCFLILVRRSSSLRSHR